MSTSRKNFLMVFPPIHKTGQIKWSHVKINQVGTKVKDFLIFPSPLPRKGRVKSNQIKSDQVI